MRHLRWLTLGFTLASSLSSPVAGQGSRWHRPSALTQPARARPATVALQQAGNRPKVVLRLLKERLADGSFIARVWAPSGTMPAPTPEATRRYSVEIFDDRSELTTEIGGEGRVYRFTPAPAGSPGRGWMLEVKTGEKWTITPRGDGLDHYSSASGRQLWQRPAALLVSPNPPGVWPDAVGSDPSQKPTFAVTGASHGVKTTALQPDDAGELLALILYDFATGGPAVSSAKIVVEMVAPRQDMYAYPVSKNDIFNRTGVVELREVGTYQVTLVVNGVASDPTTVIVNPRAPSPPAPGANAGKGRIASFALGMTQAGGVFAVPADQGLPVTLGFLFDTTGDASAPLSIEQRQGDELIRFEKLPLATRRHSLTLREAGTYTVTLRRGADARTITVIVPTR